MNHDYNNADEPRSFGLIPDGTMCLVTVDIKDPETDREGDEPLLTRSKNTDSQYLQFAFTVTSRPLEGRKFWTNLMVICPASATAESITRTTIRSMIEGAHGIETADMSDSAQTARRIEGFEDLIGLEIPVRVKVEPGRDGYEDKNVLAWVLPVDNPSYDRVMAGGTILPDDKNLGNNPRKVRERPTSRPRDLNSQSRKESALERAKREVAAKKVQDSVKPKPRTKAADDPCPHEKGIFGASIMQLDECDECELFNDCRAHMKELKDKETSPKASNKSRPRLTPRR